MGRPVFLLVLVCLLGPRGVLDFGTVFDDIDKANDLFDPLVDGRFLAVIHLGPVTGFTRNQSNQKVEAASLYYSGQYVDGGRHVS